jgi:hypothetical protein
MGVSGAHVAKPKFAGSHATAIDFALARLTVV